MADPSGLCFCARCNAPCRWGPSPNPDARLAAFATKSGGYCANCISTWFFKSNVLDQARAALTERGHTMQEVLRLPHVQEMFSNILGTAKADLKPEDVDWLEVIANWDLPFPKGDKLTLFWRE